MSPPDDPRHHQKAPADRKLSASDATPSEVQEEVTGVLKEDELRAARARRTTGERLERLEEKHDDLVDRVTNIETSAADIRGQMKVIPELVKTMRDAIGALQNRETVTLTAQVDVQKAQAMTALDLQKAKTMSAIEIDEAREKDKLAALRMRRKQLWKYASQIVALLATGAGGLKLLEYIFGGK